MKRSQLSVFVILGILAVIFSLLIFWKRLGVDTYAKDVSDFQQTKESFESYSNQCLKLMTEQALYRYGPDYVKAQQEYYIQKYFLKCMDDFNEFKKQGFDITFDEPQVNLTIEGGKVNSVVMLNLELSKNDDRAFFENFKSVFPLPNDINIDGEWIFRGILYKYEVTTDPRPMNIYVSKIDLEDPTIKYYVTPRIAPEVMATSQFLTSNELQLAINGGGFDIGGTNEVNAYAMYKGVPYSAPNITPGETVFVTKDNEVFVGDNTPDNLYYAVSGQNHMLDNGVIPDKFLNPNNPQYEIGYEEKPARTSVGKDEKNNWLNIIVIDVNGATTPDIGRLHLKYGSFNAVNMDGGGSTTLVEQDGSGYKVLYSASGTFERPVANHFGVYAEKMPGVDSISLDNTNPGATITTTPSQGGDDGSSIAKYRIVSPGIGAGGQPSPEGYKWLASQGYKTIVDVQGVDNSQAARAAGLNYIYLPYDGNPVPSSSWMTNVVSAMSNSANQPVFVHCLRGEDRTGVAIALYREQVEDWCYQQAYNELMQWAGYSFPGTPDEQAAVFEAIKAYDPCK
jgi:protein tyrosine phosphatase (PTP) superfamily phosphohydrolase (DUF442 family)